MRSLLITNINRIWTTEYISNVLKKAGVDVYIVGFEPVEDEYKEYYLKNDIHIIDLCANGNNNNKIAKMWKLYNKVKKLSKAEKFDCIDIQGIPSSIQVYILIYLTNHFATKCICTFLGSDLFRVKSNKRVKKLMRVATHIVLSTNDMQDEFRMKYGQSFDSRISDCKFGTPSFEEIKSLKQNSSKEQCKEVMGFPQNKISVAIGYNGNAEQQHLRVVKQLNQLDIVLKDKIHLIIHFGYGDDNVIYKNELLDLIRASNFDYTFIDKMLNKQEIAYLRMATDIFIHAQTTDALSGSIREIIYAECILINPRWIEYSDFNDLGIDYIQYDDFIDLPDLLCKIINKEIQIKTKNNAELAYSKYSWESVANQWMEIYD